MEKIELNYGRGMVELGVPSDNLKAVLRPGDAGACSAGSEEDIVRAALAAPVGTAALSVLAEGKKNVVVITSDHTRAVPSSITMPVLLEEIRKGSPDAEITILIATGLHRGMTEAEMRERFGDDIFESERIVNHDAFDASAFVNLGTLPSGSKCEINRIGIETDLLVAEGFIEPHFFAGYSGGRKSILPGIASQDCVNINHSAPAIGHPMAATGVLDGNPIHEDMIKAARMANLAFIFNVLLDEDKKIIEAYCGDVDAAHRKGAESLMSRCGVDAVKSPIVVTSNGGYPLDQNLYQCPKGLDAALACAEDEAVIVLAASCSDGLGGENFGELMLSAPPAQLLERILAIPPEKTISEQWCAQRFSDALCKYRIILVSEGLEKEMVEKMNFIHADSVDEALEKAFLIKGADAGVTVIPDGVGVIVRRA